MYSPETVLLAASLTAGLTISLTLYALTCKEDFTMLKGGFFVMISSVFLISFLNIVFIQSSLIFAVYQYVGVVIYGFYLIYDT